MNKQKITLLIGIIVAVALTGFFLTKTPVNKDAKQPCTTSTSTDCLRPTPIGTPYYVPPKEESLATTTQSGKIDEHLTIDNTLRDVNFCGTTYRVKQVIIDGVDVVQRVAELVKSSNTSQNEKLKIFAGDICGSVSFNQQNELNIGEVKVFISDSKNEDISGNIKRYIIFTPIFQISIKPTANEVYSINGFDGSTELIANLK